MKLLFAVLIFQLVFFPATVVSATEPAEHTEHQAYYYQCSMHPWIISDKPGNCPICGMKLTKVDANASKETMKGRASVEISPERQQLIGVTKDQAQKRSLTYSVHSVGHVAYSPDIATILGEYREAYAAYRKARVTPKEKIQGQAQQLMEIAELKLRLAGMSGDQIEQVKNASFDTRVFNNFFAPEDLTLPADHVWVDTDLYESDSELVKPGHRALMASPALAGQIFNGVVKVSEPLLNEFPRKLRVRIETEHADLLKAGMAVDVRIMVDLGEKLSIPETALLDSGHSQIVFVDRGDGHIEPRKVQTGQRADDYYEIVSGLMEGETVITSATFLIDSESRLRAAAQSFSDHPVEAAPAASGHQHSA